MLPQYGIPFILSKLALPVHDHTSIWEGGDLDHGNLLGLTDDDHVRYFDKDGSKELAGFLDFNLQSPVISGGEITAQGTDLYVDTEGGAGTDDLVNINGGTTGKIIFVHAKDDGHTIVLKHNTGNIWNGAVGDISLDTAKKIATYIFVINQWVLKSVQQ